MDVPEIGATGDYVFEDCSRFGRGVEFMFELQFPGGQAAIDLAWPNGGELALCGGVDGQAGGRDPIWKGGYET